MGWRKWGKYALILSDAHIDKVATSIGYAISKVFIGEKVIYELWELPKQTKLGTFENADSAKLRVASLKEQSALLDGKAKQNR